MADQLSLEIRACFWPNYYFNIMTMSLFQMTRNKRCVLVINNRTAESSLMQSASIKTADRLDLKAQQQRVR